MAPPVILLWFDGQAWTLSDDQRRRHAMDRAPDDVKKQLTSKARDIERTRAGVTDAGTRITVEVSVASQLVGHNGETAEYGPTLPSQPNINTKYTASKMTTARVSVREASKEVIKLLHSLFTTGNKLKVFIRYQRYGPEIVNSVNFHQSRAEVYDDTVEEMKSHGLLDAEGNMFFGPLREKFPGRLADIDRVQALWRAANR